MVRDEHGKKMSKSAGNTVDPLAWMDAYGTDAVRFTLARGANPGTDMPLGEEWVRGARNFMHQAVERHPVRAGERRVGGAAAAAPSLDRRRPLDPRRGCDEVREQVDALLEDFQFAKATEALYHFTWDEFCDWYVELAKLQLRDEAPAAEAPARCSGTSWTRCCGCCTRSCRSSPRSCGRR